MPTLQNHKVTEWLFVEGTAGNRLAQPSMQQELTQLDFEDLQ